MRQHRRKVLTFGKRPAPRKSELADLPTMNTRWVWREKAKVVSVVDKGLLSLEEACRRYSMSVEEFHNWRRIYYSAHKLARGAPRADRRRVQGRTSR